MTPFLNHNQCLWALRNAQILRGSNQRLVDQPHWRRTFVAIQTCFCTRMNRRGSRVLGPVLVPVGRNLGLAATPAVFLQRKYYKHINPAPWLAGFGYLRTSQGLTATTTLPFHDFVFSAGPNPFPGPSSWLIQGYLRSNIWTLWSCPDLVWKE